MKYLVVFLVFICVVLMWSYQKGVLPADLALDSNADFIKISVPPSEVANLLREQCYNCHSGKATYPRIAHFAPFHKKYAASVLEGRKKLNFSNWSAYSPELQKVLLLVAVEQMENNAMPIHGIFPKGNDTLAQNEKKLLIQWLAQEAEAGM